MNRNIIQLTEEDLRDIYIKQGLSLTDLENIHSWLIKDLLTLGTRNGLLWNFMFLVTNKEKCWGLFHDRGGYSVCIGFALIDNISQIELFSIDIFYRLNGLGKRFILSILNSVCPDLYKCNLISTDESVGFWEKVGFSYKEDIVPNKMELKRIIPNKQFIIR